MKSTGKQLKPRRYIHKQTERTSCNKAGTEQRANMNRQEEQDEASSPCDADEVGADVDDTTVETKKATKMPIVMKNSFNDTIFPLSVFSATSDFH